MIERLQSVIAALFFGLIATSCAAPLPKADWVDPAPLVDSVSSVVFLIGDAGNAFPGRSPVTAKLADEVERWSATLARDSTVAVFFLGDNAYPEGVRDRGEAGFPEDSLKLLSQVLTLGGDNARRFAASGYFLAGNHDWGGRPGERGILRLRNEQALLRAFREEGYLVDLVPEPGAPGPFVVDLGDHTRFVVLDTQWWLHEDEREPKERVLMELAGSLRHTGGRHVAVAAHHPFISGGMHGGGGSLGDGLGILWLLRKAGALVQDLNSAPYRELRAGLERVFREEGEPLLFVGGHDHSLQVVSGEAPGKPRWSLVSGAGSKTSAVGPVEGMLWAAERPGFMRLTFMRSGAVHLHVLATDQGFQVCDGEGAALETCMEQGAARFRVAYAMTIAPPS